MLKYNLKDMFKETIVQDDNWISNGHFIFNKSILTAGQRRMLESNPQDIERLNKLLPIIQQTKEYFEGLKEQQEFIPELIIENYEAKTETYNALHNRDIELTLKEEYYNLFISKGCKIYKGRGSINPTIIIKEGETIGVLLPIRFKENKLEDAISHKAYITRLEEEKKAKAELKKLNKKCLYIIDNKAVVRSKPLKCITEYIPDDRFKNIYVDNTPEGQHGYVDIYIDLDIIHMSINQSIRVNEISENKEAFLTLTDTTLENYKEEIDNRLINNRWITVSEVKLMELKGESKEYLNKLLQHRKDFRYQQEQREKEKQLQKEREDKEYIDEKNRIANNMITQAELDILKGNRVVNEDITLYTDRWSSNTTSLILHMIKLYDIKVPLKTQGWINNALNSIKMNNSEDGYTYDYYSRSADSTVFYKYLDMLVEKVKEKYKEVA